MGITIDDLKNISSVNQLSSIASLDEIIKIIEMEIKPLAIHVNTYDELYKVIETLKKHWDSFQSCDYFKNESAQYIFALTRMDGKQRNEIIGLNNELYDNKAMAQKWFKSITKKIHPDMNLNNTKDAEEAMIVLQRIYDRIAECFDNDEEE